MLRLIKPSAFLSYRRLDFGDKIHDLANSLHKRGVNTKYDIEYLRTGDWELAIDKMIVNSHFLVCVLGVSHKEETKTNTLDSEQVRRELNFAYHKKKEVCTGFLQVRLH